jgi:hypothetical protein
MRSIHAAPSWPTPKTVAPVARRQALDESLQRSTVVWRDLAQPHRRAITQGPTLGCVYADVHEEGSFTTFHAMAFEIRACRLCDKSNL